MVLPARTKTYITLAVGVVVLVLVLIPFRFGAQGPLGIEILSIGARAQLVQKYEKPAQRFAEQGDSLRRAIIARNGWTTPSQDSILRALDARARQMQQVVDHLRHPEKTTFEEKSADITGLLTRLMSEAEGIRRGLIEDYLQ